MAFLKRLIRALPLLLLSPFLMAISFLALLLTDLAASVLARKSAARGSHADGPRWTPPHHSACGDCCHPHQVASVNPYYR